jgi:molybdate transport repressor ModE-like protein
MSLEAGASLAKNSLILHDSFKHNTTDMRIRIKPDFYLEQEQGTAEPIGRVLELLIEVEQRGNLRAACEALAIPYRSAWNMVVTLERRLGGPVLEMTRGRGSALTDLGRKLLWAKKLVHARFDPLLHSMAMEIDAQVQLAIAKGQEYLRIYASHGYAIASLNTYLQKIHAPVELSYRGSLEALKALKRRACDVAGFHVPIGELEASVLGELQPLLLQQHRLINIATRRQGLMVRKGNPKEIWSFEDLFKPEISFVNRQQGSGTRVILELLLKRSGRSGHEIPGFEAEELTHAAVAAYVASGMADVGLGVEAAARQFKLDFIPLLTERYFFVCDESTLSDPRFAEVLSFLQGPRFHAELLTLPGYDAVTSSQIMTVAEAFPAAYPQAAQDRNAS